MRHVRIVTFLALAAACASSRSADTAPTRGPSPGIETPTMPGDREIAFDIPAQPAAPALLAFAKQADIEVLFSFSALRSVRSAELRGRYLPQSALDRLLRGTGYVARRNGTAKFVVSPETRAAGAITGRLVAPDGLPAAGVRVAIPGTRHAAYSDFDGRFALPAVPPGAYRLAATSDRFQTHPILGVQVASDTVTTIEPQVLHPVDDPTQLAPFVVLDQAGKKNSLDRSDAHLAPRTAGGNLDLARTESDALPFTVYNRDQIARSGVVNLNEFLQRELLDADAGTRPPEQNGTKPTFEAGSTNLNLRGYGADQTIVLVNGRRLPEVLTSGSGTLPPDVNFIPLSLVQQVEVLPISAASLYTGNAVGGVINIVLRPGVDAEATEVAATYTNALADYDAPQSSVSLLHGRSLLGGALRVRFNASVTRATPPTETELGFLQGRAAAAPPALHAAVHRATPNIRNAAVDLVYTPGTRLVSGWKLAPLFGPNSSPVTSVAPGADGRGGRAAFAGREGVRNLAFFDAPGGLAASLDSGDYPYGRAQVRTAYFGSAVLDVTRWLQLGFDGTYTRTTLHRGYDVLAADLRLGATHALNPFGQDVMVALNETAPLLGENYSEARLEFGSAVGSALISLPGEWRVLLDGQYGRNIAKYRGLAGADIARWQTLVDQGGYNPLRDTRVFAPPPEFYDRVLVYRGGPGRFVTLGDYEAIDAAVRVTNHRLALPTGRAVLNFGGDYRRNQLFRYRDVRTYADGSLAAPSIHWAGRLLQRYSVFGELQAPLLPARWLPAPIRAVDADVAVRYIASDNASEASVAPTFAAKIDFVGGFTLRGSLTTSSRFPTPSMNRIAITPPAGLGTGGVAGLDTRSLYDPKRNEYYRAVENEIIDPNLRAEGAVTQTAGVVFQTGRTHRFRAALDFVDTRKVNELITLELQTVLNLEDVLPDRVLRAPSRGDDTVGRVLAVTTGTTNLSWRRSQNWSTSVDYAWTECFGGTLDFYARGLFFERYRRQVFPNSPVVDELRAPDGVAPGLLKFRAKFGGGWSTRDYGFGFDGHYFHARTLPLYERFAQGSDHIRPFWQFDAFAQCDLARWFTWAPNALRAQLRVNNLFGFDFPKYVNDPSGAGVQAYGDWRRRVYSLSLTTSF